MRNAAIGKGNNLTHRYPVWKGLFLLFALIPAIALFAGSEDEAIDMYGRMFEKATQDLKNGGPQEKIHAAMLMGGQKEARFIRPLGEALLQDLDNPVMLSLPVNDPYVKSNIAWAIGRIGHRWSIPDLVKALDLTDAIIDARATRSEAYKKSHESKDSYEVFLNVNKPGPALLGNGYRFPASPDTNWSVADELKKNIAPDTKDEQVRLRLIGYNYINQSLSILQALQMIGMKNRLYFQSLSLTEESKNLLEQAYQSLGKNLEYPIPAIRSASASALGGIGTLKALSMLEGRFEKEPDDEVKVFIARAILTNDKTRTPMYNYLLSQLQNHDTHVRLETAVAFRELSMGESIFTLREALEAEAEPVVRQALQEAIDNAERDNITPVNY